MKPVGHQALKIKADDGFTIIPAIDLKDGRCVRLQQGLASRQTVYSADPVETALRWERQGATLLHVIDLDGAFQGRPVNTGLVGRIAAAVSIPIQVGGGLRSAGDLQLLLDHGAARVIIGTSACLAAAALAETFRERLVVGIDARDGLVQIKGWTETVPINFLDMAGRVADMGVNTIIYTNTALDGMLRGPDVAGIATLCDKVACKVIAAGGISAPEHVKTLRRLCAPNLTGAIVGKALYDGKVSFKELID